MFIGAESIFFRSPLRWKRNKDMTYIYFSIEFGKGRFIFKNNDTIKISIRTTVMHSTLSSEDSLEGV